MRSSLDTNGINGLCHEKLGKNQLWDAWHLGSHSCQDCLHPPESLVSSTSSGSCLSSRLCSFRPPGSSRSIGLCLQDEKGEACLPTLSDQSQRSGSDWPSLATCWKGSSSSTPGASLQAAVPHPEPCSSQRGKEGPVAACPTWLL